MKLRMMNLWRLLALLAGLQAGLANANELVVVGHAQVPRLDTTTLQRLYTGRVVEVNGLNITVVNAAPGSPARQRFLSQVVQLDEDRYRAYWTVRRHVGKGTPPRELSPSAAVLDFVQATPGAVGYVLASELRAGVNVVARP